MFLGKVMARTDLLVKGVVAVIEVQDLEVSLVCWNSLIQGGPVRVDAVEDGNQEKPLELISNPSLHK